MKKILISAVLVLVVGCLFTSCTSVPQDTNSNASTTSTTSRTYSK